MTLSTQDVLEVLQMQELLAAYIIIKNAQAFPSSAVCWKGSHSHFSIYKTATGVNMLLMPCMPSYADAVFGAMPKIACFKFYFIKIPALERQDLP